MMKLPSRLRSTGANWRGMGEREVRKQRDPAHIENDSSGLKTPRCRQFSEHFCRSSFSSPWGLSGLVLNQRHDRMEFKTLNYLQLVVKALIEVIPPQGQTKTIEGMRKRAGRRCPGNQGTP